MPFKNYPKKPDQGFTKDPEGVTSKKSKKKSGY